MTAEKRFTLILSATPETLARIDALLEGKTETPCVKLYTVTQAAKEAGFSRATACRMINAGTLRTVELRPGCRRVPASELVRIAKGGAA